MNWIYTLLLLLINFSNNFVEEQSNRMTFIISIDNSIPIADILNGSFTIFDSLSNAIDSIPFDYHIGWLEVTTANYNKLLIENSTNELTINFEFQRLYDEIFTQKYIEKIPRGWLNEQYVIIYAHNDIDPFCRKKYALKKGTYEIEIISPKGKIILKKNRLIIN